MLTLNIFCVIKLTQKWNMEINILQDQIINSHHRAGEGYLLTMVSGILLGQVHSSTGTWNPLGGCEMLANKKQIFFDQKIEPHRSYRAENRSI